MVKTSQKVRYSRWDGVNLIAQLKRDEIDLRRLGFDRFACKRLAAVLERIDYLERKLAESERPKPFAENELDALVWVVYSLIKDRQIAAGETQVLKLVRTA